MVFVLGLPKFYFNLYRFGQPSCEKAHEKKKIYLHLNHWSSAYVRRRIFITFLVHIILRNFRPQCRETLNVMTRMIHYMALAWRPRWKSELKLLLLFTITINFYNI